MCSSYDCKRQFRNININPKDLKTELNILKKAGAKIKFFDDKILIKGPKVIKSIKNIKTKEWLVLQQICNPNSWY